MNGLGLGGYAPISPTDHIAGDVRPEAPVPAARSHSRAVRSLVLAVPLGLIIVFALTATGVGVLNAANERSLQQLRQITAAEGPQDAGGDTDPKAREGAGARTARSLAETSAAGTGGPSPGSQPRAERARGRKDRDGAEGGKKEKRGRGKGHGREKHKH